MKLGLAILALAVTTMTLSACASSDATSSSTVGMESRQTGRIPSPRNINATNMMNSSRMIAPTAQ